MKNLKMFAIGLAAFAAMTMSVHAEMQKAKDCQDVDGVETCTLSDDSGTISGTVANNKKVVVIGGGKKINLGAVTLEKGSSLEIKGAYVTLTDNVTIKNNATLTITDAPKETGSSTKIPALKIASKHTITVNGGTLNVTGNESYSAIVVVESGKDSSIVLDKATLNVSDNRGNGMQGANSLVLTAEDSTINVKNNTSNGLGATFKLENTNINASGNGYAGIIFGKNSSIDETSHVNARGNLTANDDTAKQKADILLDNGDADSASEVATINVKGYIDTGSIAPTKVTWTHTDSGKVSTGKLVVTGNNVKVDKTVDVCSDANNQKVFSCSGANKVTIAADSGEYAIVTIGDEARLYANAENEEITLDKAYDNLVITENATMKKLTVVSGTEVTNEKTTELVVYEAGAERPIVVPAKEEGKDPVAVTVGVKAPDDQPGNTGDANTPGTTNPDVPNVPKTNDNILVYASLGLVSALTVGFTARIKENN